MTDLRSLKTLLAVVEYGSIHLAARALFVSHSTASRQIKTFEEHYGTTLFDRSASGVVPTGQGLALADFARRMIAESELLSDSFGNYSRASRPSLSSPAPGSARPSSPTPSTMS
ncbi:LysR family transcriptional regulator [Brevibacterium sp. BDJS002]|uniref:LysR family transcriptional regulator n=1 Tax=Brevibacterium sp. BDJS002 TaxID=3020906 RepID=UPI0023079DBC|nr:LysR family transcriptional regulator [Brevibacterium sp. BDJS002]WCE40299.1 LysR family transcriptional regulator [Brevibacterium sp. BDJS002]